MSKNDRQVECLLTYADLVNDVNKRFDSSITVNNPPKNKKYNPEYIISSENIEGDFLGINTVIKNSYGILGSVNYSEDSYNKLFRAVPSGGGIYPNEIYLFLKKEDNDFILHYNPILDQYVLVKKGRLFSQLLECIKSDGRNTNESFIFITTNYIKNWNKYKYLSYKLQLLDTGALIGQLALESSLNNLKMELFPLFNTEKTTELFGINSFCEIGNILIGLHPISKDTDNRTNRIGIQDYFSGKDVENIFSNYDGLFERKVSDFINKIHNSSFTSIDLQRNISVYLPEINHVNIRRSSEITEFNTNPTYDQLKGFFQELLKFVTVINNIINLKLKIIPFQIEDMPHINSNLFEFIDVLKCNKDNFLKQYQHNIKLNNSFIDLFIICDLEELIIRHGSIAYRQVHYFSGVLIQILYRLVLKHNLIGCAFLNYNPDEIQRVIKTKKENIIVNYKIGKSSKEQPMFITRF
ncbi:hypothetical protein ACWE42_20630 [Sutcliffiella cohnii]